MAKKVPFHKSPAYNVMSYGAHADGTTDDVAHILSAITAAGSAPVYFPPGTYYLASRLTIPGYANLLGAGMASSWLKGPVSPGSNGSFTDMKIGADNFDTSLKTVSNLTFTRCRFHGGGGTDASGYNPNPAHLMTVGGGWDGAGNNWTVTNVLFDACEVEANIGPTETYMDIAMKCGTGASDTKVESILFHDCHFLGNSPGITVEMYSTHDADHYVGIKDVNFDGCTFEAVRATSIDYSGAPAVGGVFPTGHSYVRDCHFLGNGIGTPIWSNAVTIEKGSSYVEVSGCDFARCTQRAVSIQDGGSYNLIDGNTIDYRVNSNVAIGTASMISVEEGSNGGTRTNNTITNNTIYDSSPGASSYGIALYSDSNDSTVTGNTITGGTVLNQGSGNTVSGNTYL